MLIRSLEVIVDGPKKVEVMNDICHVAKPEVFKHCFEYYFVV